MGEPCNGGRRPDEDATQSVSNNEFTALFQELRPELWRFTLGVVKDAHLAEDIVQATFTKALERRSEIRCESIQGWLFTVAYREALALKRKQASWIKTTAKLSAWWLTRQAETSDPLVAAETVERLRRGIEGLPGEQAEVVRLRIEQGLSFAEIARERHLPLGTVLTRMRLAMARLRKELE